MNKLVGIAVGGMLFISAGTVACGGGLSASDHYQAGLVAAQQGDWDKAREEFDAAGSYNDAPALARNAQQQSATARAAFEDAKQAIEDEKWFEAYTKLQTVLAISPDGEEPNELMAEVSAKLEDLYQAGVSAEESGEFVTAIDAFTAAGAYKDSTTQAAAISAAQNELASLYGAMKQFEADNNFAEAARTAKSITERVADYRDVAELLEQYKEALYVASSDAQSAGRLRDAIGGFQALAQVDPQFRDVQERIGQAQAQLRTARPGNYPVNQTETYSGVAVTITSIDVLPGGELRINERVRNNRSYGARWTETAQGHVFIMDEDGNRYVPTGWGTAAGPLQLDDDELELAVGQEIEAYVTFPPLKDASKTFSFRDSVEFTGLSIAP